MGSSNTFPLILAAVGSLLCCGSCFLFVVLIVGWMVLRKRGKKASPRQAVVVGVQEMSRAFVRGMKSREELLREEDEEEGR
jgi:high-affinity Fe2+/Pb2+ permease